MKHLSSLWIIGSLFLVACAPTAPTAQHGGTKSGGHQQGTTQGSTNLIVRDQSTDTEIAFSVLNGDETFSDYGISHTKEMHLIVVRDDLRYFHHLHPQRDADGIWRVAFTPPSGGTYWRYADFVDTDQKTYTIRFDRTFEGDLKEYGLQKSFETTKIVDGYRFALRSAVSGNEVSFTYDITDAAGNRPHLEEYLGAIGHSVLISPSGDFIHTHPSGEGETPVFVTKKPSDDFYRIFTQFQIRGKVVTVNFDWQP